jgi:hypothetical protein
MNLNIFKEPDPSGRMSKESYVSKTYTEEYKVIIDYCNSNNIMDIPFKEKVYLFLNSLNSTPLCKNPNCDNKVNYINSTLGYREYCSNKCIGSDPNIQKIKEEKSILKFGTKTPAESKQIKEKIIKTNQERYGGNSPQSNTDIRNKSKETLLKNWGVDNPGKNETILKKRIESFKKSDYKENFKKTSVEKYGVEHPWMNKEIHNKSINKSILTKNKKISNIIENKLTNTNYNLISIDYDKFKREIQISCVDCGSNFKINREDFHHRFKSKTTICTNCNPINSSKSGSEMELVKFISSVYNKTIITNRKIIYPYELDIYLPDDDLAFEFNGLYWHSEDQKGKNYHYIKTKKCEESGIELTHIWEDDWVYNNDIIKSIILNKLSLTKNKIFARKCIISDVSIKESSKFLEENHILGNCKSNIKIGLYHNNILISLMCFSKNKGDFELVRFCNLLNTNVIGGASRIFKYFINKYKPVKITSYSDNSMFTGDLYEKLGFEFINETKINYKWVLNKKRCHKSNYRKDRLVKDGYDPSKSESDIMIEDVGSYKVWDCGLKKWVYKT